MFQPKLTTPRCRRNVDNFLEACRRTGVEEVSFLLLCVFLTWMFVYLLNSDVYLNFHFSVLVTFFCQLSFRKGINWLPMSMVNESCFSHRQKFFDPVWIQTCDPLYHRATQYDHTYLSVVHKTKCMQLVLIIVLLLMFCKYSVT